MDYKKAAEKVVEFILAGKEEKIRRYYTEDTKCMIPDFPNRGITQIYHRTYSLISSSRELALVTGQSRGEDSDYMDATIAFSAAGDGLRIKLVHISPAKTGNCFTVKDIREKSYRVRESQILYIEACKNHIIWHCLTGTFESMGTMADTAKQLNRKFVRVHRSYIVNCDYITMVARCYVQMENEDIIPIPVKRYCAVKEMLARASAAPNYVT